MKKNCFKFMSLATIAAMTLCTACSEEDNEPQNSSEESSSAAQLYSSELFQSRDNNNFINYNFEGFFSNKFVGTIDGGQDMSLIDAFFEPAGYRGAVSEKSDWTDGWVRTEGKVMRQAEMQ